MPTHVSANVKELKELGKNLYAAMRSDWEVNPNAPSLPIDYFKTIVAWFQAHRDDPSMMDDVLESCTRAGLSADDRSELQDYLSGTLFRNGILDVERLWSMTTESSDEWGDNLPLPVEYR